MFLNFTAVYRHGSERVEEKEMSKMKTERRRESEMILLIPVVSPTEMRVIDRKREREKEQLIDR